MYVEPCRVLPGKRWVLSFFFYPVLILNCFVLVGARHNQYTRAHLLTVLPRVMDQVCAEKLLPPKRILNYERGEPTKKEKKRIFDQKKLFHILLFDSDNKKVGFVHDKIHPATVTKGDDGGQNNTKHPRKGCNTTINQLKMWKANAGIRWHRHDGRNTALTWWWFLS